MLTVAVLLSGPHRRDMLEMALESIPLESDSVSQLIIRHQGGPWDWADDLRERWTAHPKVRLIEFPDRVDFAHSFNRTLDAIETPWGLILPDDDALMRPSAKVAFETVAAHGRLEDLGLVALGWNYLQNGRYRADYVRRRDVASAVYFTPKFCTTLMNMARVREIGGFQSDVGGYCDTALFSRLAFEFGGLYTREAAGIYRLHDGQESVKMRTVYAPFVERMCELLEPYARSEGERQALIRSFEASTSTFAEGVKQPLMQLNYRLRSESTPRESEHFELRAWDEPE